MVELEGDPQADPVNVSNSASGADGSGSASGVGESGDGGSDADGSGSASAEELGAGMAGPGSVWSCGAVHEVAPRQAANTTAAIAFFDFAARR
ncbi:hypothetical protein ASH00_15565 [Arthrobacter sp. Soil782]|nr:hypothetical protein ASH00_15565 [Arthrobacter sp. Soil782]